MDSDFEDQEVELQKLQELQKKVTRLGKGDRVRIVKGDLTNVTGSVVRIKGKLVEIKPDIKEIPHSIDQDISVVAKHFTAGEHVAVVAGKYQGERGLLTKVAGDSCFLVSETSRRELQVFTNDLKLSSLVA